MDHPNIAKVHDAGAAPDGRPFFVMELVRGVPITKYCDDHHLTPRERLELFVPVCQAIQHAHQKGVIHRDIKPSNVLVALYDDKPVPKVIDFGVAKATGQQLTERTLHTSFGAVVGTVEYMSPEQATFNQLDVDTRSDVYSLGVLLYELLAGSPPFSKKELERAGVLEMLRVIREQEPSKPSTKLSTADGLPTLAANRGTEPAKLTRLVRGELDWIVMKALEKDRNRRYDTASGLALDVQRYLADEPVQACPPSAGYRLRKFLKRHRGAVLVASVVVLALLAGVGGLATGLVHARRQRDLAEQARADEAKAREAEAKARLDTDWLLYASRINLAQQAWDGNDAGVAVHYLDSCRPDFRGWEYDYLFTLFHTTSQRTLRGGPSTVSAVAVSPGGRHVVTGSGDGTVKVWDVDTGEITLTLRGHTPGVKCVAVSPDGRRVASGSSDGAVKVWDTDSGREVRTIRAHDGPVQGVAFSPEVPGEAGAGRRIASASAGRLNRAEVKVWDADTGGEVVPKLSQPGYIESVAFSPSGKHIAIASADGTMKLWFLGGKNEVRTLQGQPGTVGAAFSPDGRRIASGSYDGAVRVWDVSTGRIVHTIRGHMGHVNSVTFSPDGKYIVSGSNDRTVKVWTSTGQEVRSFKGHTHQVTGVAVMPDGHRIVSGSADTTVRIWDLAASPATRTLRTDHPPVSALALSPDGKRGASGSNGINLITVWDAATGQKIRGYFLGQGSVTGVTFSPDGRYLASSNADGTVAVVDTATGTIAQTFRGHADKVHGVAWSPGEPGGAGPGRRLASCSSDRTVRVWDVSTGREALTLRGHTHPVMCVAWSPDGGRIVSGGLDQTLRVWDADTGQEVVTLSGHAGSVQCVAFSPGVPGGAGSGRRVVSGGQDGTLKVWDVDTGQDLLTLRGHAGAVNCVAWHPGGQRILSGGSDGTIRVWDAATGHQTLTVKADPFELCSLAVSPGEPGGAGSGRRVYTGGSSGRVKVWDAGMSQRTP
jgi:WD40 repeat protein